LYNIKKKDYYIFHYSKNNLKGTKRVFFLIIIDCVMTLSPTGQKAHFFFGYNLNIRGQSQQVTCLGMNHNYYRVVKKISTH